MLCNYVNTIKMLYCNRINVSESIHVHKESAPRGSIICHY